LQKKRIEEETRLFACHRDHKTFDGHVHRSWGMLAWRTLAERTGQLMLLQLMRLIARLSCDTSSAK
jgi:hypothetical protein